MRPRLPLLLAVLLSSPFPSLAQEAAPVKLYGRWQGHFASVREVSPDTEFTAELTSPCGRKHTVPGFWDGGSDWRVRFLPTEAGRWKYRTRSAPKVEGLDGKEGTFDCRQAEGQDNALLRHGPLRVAKAGTYLEHADGTPFFWLGDTVWNMAILAGGQDVNKYLADRSAKQFNVIQFVTMAPWRAAPADVHGETAFTGRQNVTINPKYFQRLDKRFDRVNEAGLVAAPVLVWALTKNDPGQYLPEADILKLVRYQLARYGAHHVVWILAGDNPYNAQTAERWKRVGRSVFGAGPHAPVTTHPTGMNWPWDGWEKETWLDVLGYQSGHGDDARTLAWIHSGPVAESWKKWHKPVVNLEPPYEDHVAYQSRKPHSAYNVRRAVYWSLLNAPTAGVTYGAHGLWSWQTEPGVPTDHPGSGVAKAWHEALKLPGATAMKHAATLFTSLPWWQLRPAPDLLTKQPGGTDPAKFVAAARTPDGDAAVLYLPVGGTVTVNVVRGPAKGAEPRWFDPRTGEYQPVQTNEAGVYAAPDNQDWVLVFRTRAKGK